MWGLLPRLPASPVAGADLGEVVVLDVDATLVTAHSEKERARATFKGGFGFHPIGVWCDNTTELLAISLRPGNAGSNHAGDHIDVLTRAIAQVPTAYRRRLLVRADGAGATHELLDWLTGSAQVRGRRLEYSVGFPTKNTALTSAITTIPERVWTPAIASDGEIREGAEVAEVTGLLDLRRWPAGMRVIVRRERPHPGAQLSLLEEADGWRYQAFATNTRVGQLAFLEARHRAHARVEDRIKAAKDTGLGRFPSREYAINQAWVQIVAVAADLLAAGLELGVLLDRHQALAALRDDRQSRVVAERADVDAERARGLEHVGALLDRHRHAVDRQRHAVRRRGCRGSGRCLRRVCWGLAGYVGHLSHSPPIMLIMPKIGTMSAIR